MKKQGFLLAEETLKIILAVIAISFLAFLLFSLYKANKGAADLELAKESLDFLASEINSEREQVQIYNPEGWHLGSWPHEVTEGFSFVGIPFSEETSTQTPLSCSNLGWENCLCICKDNMADSCDEKGICLESDFEIRGDDIEISDPPVTLDIDYENKQILEVK